MSLGGCSMRGVIYNSVHARRARRTSLGDGSKKVGDNCVVRGTKKQNKK